MIEIEYFQPHNLLCFGELEPINLWRRGVVLLLGENRDEPTATSNEAGKTSLIEGIAWTLYGESVRWGSQPGNNIMNIFRTGEGGTFGMVQFTADGDRYRVTRARKHPVYRSELFFERIPKKGMPEDLRLHNAEATTERIIATTGMDFDLFWYRVGFSQSAHRFADVASRSDNKVKGIFARLLEFDVVDRCVKHIREQRRELLERQSERADSLSEVAAMLAEAKQQVEEEKGRLAAAKQGRAKQERIAEIGIEMIGPAKAWANIQGIEQQLKTLQEHRDKLVENQTMTIRQMDTFEHTMKSTERELERVEAKLLSVEADIREAASKNLGKPCTRCGRNFTKHEIPFLVKHYESEIDELMKEKSRLEHLHAEAEKGFISSSKSRQKRIKLLHENKEAMDERRAAKEKHKPEADKLEALKAKCDALAEAGEDSIAVIKENILRAQSLVEKYEARESKLASRVVALEQRVKKCDDAEKVYLKLKGFLIDDAIPVMNDSVATALETLTEGALQIVFSPVSYTKKGEQRDDFEMKIISKTGLPYRARSQGYRRRIDLAATYALQRLSAAPDQGRARGVGLAAYDDAFAELDEAGIERTMRFIQQVSHEFGTVLVMAPDERLSQYFSTVWRVVKHKGIATIMEES